MLSKLFISLCVVAVVVAKKGNNTQGGHGGPGGPGGPGGHGGHGGQPPPPFLQNVTDDARKAFFDIVINGNLTQAQIDTETSAWASTYGVLDIYNEFQQNKTAFDAEIRTNITSVIGNLANVNTQLNSIFSNKDQTHDQVKTAIDGVRQNYPVEVDTLMHLAHPGPPHGGPGGPGGPGGRGGRGGHGGPGGNDSSNSTASTKTSKKNKKNSSSR
ncbi:SXP/RAL-2 family protein Ani s 5-like cation-binding domain-containing protein [Caenorhabditis elegans]|uniref:SXP/RAL-2 family protein Ani s 5-like cation-binding domain-containing protein n=1 Tax=Caenorhabditis elegans TaxID=6239 RepID=Q19406_CAEEL|nr:SXP/RAL-2 family protein Ani s 5-like cation-binding domain-containing protein [Caenorhabditis elegans]CAA93404.4 SXP/RAL-2 family protein Ani s 5-like cation-binding domain-containing protein [Caenorhabditis elegans]|eukprot:NP_502023.3 Uncharacterized protein CELE_F13E9.8 [Caenorhabditis elegans]